MEDRDIVELFWQRSSQAIQETDSKYGKYCHTIAYNICQSNEDSEECVNDTWLSAWNMMPDKRPNTLRALLGSICRNFALDRWRKNHRQRRGGGEAALALEELSECIPAGQNIENELLTKELGEAVKSFVNGLGQDERNVFIARYYFLAQISEIAEKHNFTAGKTKMMLHRSRIKLQRFLKEEGLC